MMIKEKRALCNKMSKLAKQNNWHDRLGSGGYARKEEEWQKDDDTLIAQGKDPLLSKSEAQIANMIKKIEALMNDGKFESC
uniref:Uncharacterized protein n=1 Tax=Leersia perrieri TaxID=77586 RepID=A0A0D9WZF0_9ORYZ